MSSDRPEETAAEPEPRLGSGGRYGRGRAVPTPARQADTETTVALGREASDAVFPATNCSR
jgi:hypothetical protein